MVFFNKKQKQLAERHSASHLRTLYEFSEKQLLNSAKSGDLLALKEHMEKHRMFEYALLYKHTPEFKEKQRSKKWKNLKK